MFTNHAAQNDTKRTIESHMKMTMIESIRRW
ncbi:hypothetical protein OIU76_018086 [Salix suchowensis]|uniref:Uncharacterized protein n=1 Tax=Salix koriyanagi TaxID=2511006 RepID=A0A9Q0T4U2_9ROSI|nr:hypothetical protein OIU76_018086 [Salix suchowensis]KAJ6701404.1 hypothetical protein OIU74_012713 [Salix koriyanagi]